MMHYREYGECDVAEALTEVEKVADVDYGDAREVA
jgi:hypothetical protein